MTFIGCFHPLKQAYTKRIVTQKWRLYHSRQSPEGRERVKGFKEVG